MQNNRVKFRFEDLDIWNSSVDIAMKLFTIADTLGKKKLFRFAEQIRGAALSVPNDIAEGSGSTSKKEFVNFLNIARRSVFENASMLIIFNKTGLIENTILDDFLLALDKLGRMITSFSRSLKE